MTQCALAALLLSFAPSPLWRLVVAQNSVAEHNHVFHGRIEPPFMLFASSYTTGTVFICDVNLLLARCLLMIIIGVMQALLAWCMPTVPYC